MEAYEKRHIEILRALAPECMVLLKSDGSFPLNEPGKIALYGCGGRRTIKGGTGSGDVDVRHFTTIEEGLESAGFTITSKGWLDAYDECKAAAAKELNAAIKQRVLTEGLQAAMMTSDPATEPEYEFPLDGDGDTAIYVLARISGEGGDRAAKKGDVMLSDAEVRDILAANRKYPRFLLVLNTASVVDLSPVLEEVNNILLISQTGITIGDSFADVLLGKNYPSGKLADTWAAWEDYCTEGNFGDKDDTYYREGIYVGYRYFDTMSKTPLFPFGYGLGYTVFDLEERKISLSGSEIAVSVRVKNTGTRPGKEVVQLYVSIPDGKLEQPYQVLAAFSKTRELQADEYEELTLRFDLRDIACFDSETACTVLEKGSYVIRLGTSSRETKPLAIVALDETVVVRRLTHIGGKPDFADWKPEKQPVPKPSGIPMLTLKATDIAELPLPKRHESSSEAKKLAALMTDEELAYLCMGGFRDGGQRHFIGNSDMLVAGAAGQTTERLSAYGIPPVVMSDGPAGLRLSRMYGKDEDGVYSIDNGVLDYLKEILPEPILSALQAGKPKERHGTIHEQNCTAIPVGAALAQSWNPSVCETCGDIVGEEMELFNVDLWLAPALNIHRSILCGRNFEYYSEDPLISGKMAAAIIKGVQRHPGKGVTIKHFACNNQEYNRFYSNSQVSERALRDIYLKGFEIAVTESKPMTVMTSYNLINGVHTAQREDLLETVLRDEWGFEGVVMSDWIILTQFSRSLSKHPAVHTAGAIGAGNDIMMPGSDSDHSTLLDALRNPEAPYQLTRKQLEKCAARVIDLVLSIKRSKTW